VSVLLRPSIPAVRLPLLPLAAGLAAAEAIRATTGLSVDLRWPNDLLIGPRKVGGILVEAGAGSKSLPYAVVGQPYAAVSLPHAVVGIGINVHQHSFAPGLATPATSLDLEAERQAGKPASRQALLVALLKSLEDEALGLADPGSSESILRRVLGASTWMSGRSVQVHGPQGCTGVTAGLDANGFLLVETETGRVTVQTGGLRDATRA
jgi:BirA family biotin operon repressor/biotin-[acetyl-CoA-carboxylase] ligase